MKSQQEFLDNPGCPVCGYVFDYENDDPGWVGNIDCEEPNNFPKSYQDSHICPKCDIAFGFCFKLVGYAIYDTQPKVIPFKRSERR